jgi:hypothetical protein
MSQRLGVQNWCVSGDGFGAGEGQQEIDKQQAAHQDNPMPLQVQKRVHGLAAG